MADINPNDRVEAIWCVDSETGEELLIDLITSKILGKKNENGGLIPYVKED